MTARRRTQRRKPSARPRSWEKKFENMRGRQSIGFELTRDELENLVFPQAVEEKF